MKPYTIFFLLLVLSLTAAAQNSLTVLVRDTESGSPLSGVEVRIKDIEKKTNMEGKVIFTGLPDGVHLISLKIAGYTERTTSATLPDAGAELVVHLEENDHLEEVVISSTRNSRTIDANPTRIEVIAGEELDEKANMKPGDLRMILNESTGIQTQQISAGSGNALIRIQGLEGRYTQILKDGFPLYSGAASGLGLLQTPPLDLKQVEVIKGSSSTLYGGGAIAGLVNLISKTPAEHREINLHLNGTSAGGLDLNTFFSQKFGTAGITIFASRNSNKAYDPSEYELSAIPQFERYVFNPKLFLDLNSRTTLQFGLNTSIEDRTGGMMEYFENSQSSGVYFENNKSKRASTQFSFSHQLGDHGQLNIKNSVSYFNRQINIPDYEFEGTQLSSFSEINYTSNREPTAWIVGVNSWTDRFDEKKIAFGNDRSYSQPIVGLFAQNTTRFSSRFELEAGIRTDFVADYGVTVLPRISGLFTISDKLSSRLGAGMGYKVPDIFTEENERLHFRYTPAVNTDNLDLEKSYGANWDVNFVTGLFSDQVVFTLNHMFFYTRLQNPLFLGPGPADGYEFYNADNDLKTQGMETNAKLATGSFKLFIGYTLTDSRFIGNSAGSARPLISRHRLNNVLMYEEEDKWKIGLEAYYSSRQLRGSGDFGKPYWITGFMTERLWESFSLYLNFENFTDTRQTRFESIYSGTRQSPQFRDIYAPLDGFVINGGIKFRL